VAHHPIGSEPHWIFVKAPPHEVPAEHGSTPTRAETAETKGMASRADSAAVTTAVAARANPAWVDSMGVLLRTAALPDSGAAAADSAATPEPRDQQIRVIRANFGGVSPPSPIVP